MDKKALRYLRIDKEIQSLKLPLQSRAYAQLEHDLCSKGCLDPLIAWNDNLLDGYNRYEICIRHQIPFSVMDLQFPSRDAAIAWVCKDQLQRSDLPLEARRFLIGLQCESEKAVGVPMRSYTDAAFETGIAETEKTRGNNMLIAQLIARENDIVYASVMRNVLYARALIKIRRHSSFLFTAILSARLHITHDDVQELSNMSADQINQASQILKTAPGRAYSYRKLRSELTASASKAARSNSMSVSSIKDMPAYDPDAEITGLTLTIPSWTSSLSRISTKSNLKVATDSACANLEDALLDLQGQIFDMLSAIRRN